MNTFINFGGLENTQKRLFFTLYLNKMKSMALSARGIIFFSLFLIASIPILIFAIWVERSAVQKEIDAVTEKHLVVARNMSSAISRYVMDVKLVIGLLENLNVTEIDVGPIREKLDNIHIGYVATLNAYNEIQSHILSSSFEKIILPDIASLTELRKIAATAGGEFAFSGIQNFGDTPHLFVVKDKGQGRLLIAQLATTYLNEIQKSIAFGEKGHSMIVDQYGRIIAHPMEKWQAESKDVSKLSVVRKMMAGETGVMQFYSPPMKADMIAGYTFVPESGWGVMVPQPMSELIRRARYAQSVAIIIAGVEVILAFLLSAFLSKVLSIPVLAVVDAAEHVSKGDLTTRIETQSKYLPKEMKLLFSTFNEMAFELNNSRDRLSTALLKAEDGSRTKSQFMAMMTHEIRTPLSGISGVMDLLADSELDEEQSECVSIAQNLSEGLLQIINSILDFSRLETNKVEVEKVPFNVRQLVDEIHSLFQSLAKEKGVSFTKIVSADVPNIIISDVQRIRQILFNIVGNAAKFTSRGAVDLSVGMTMVNANEGVLKIEVSDTGIGIPEDMAGKLFEDYVQCDASNSRQFGGTGLGLAISKRLTDLLGGEIGYTSQIGKGSTFFVTLPVEIQGESSETP